MISVHLHEIIVFAHHGIYEDEKISGNKFEVNLDVRFKSKGLDFDLIGDTVDYEVLNKIVHDCMKVPTPLLEKVCLAIVREIKSRYSFVSEINVSVFKLQPPIKDFHGKAGASMLKRFRQKSRL